MNIKFHEHAVQRMHERNITTEDVKQIILAPNGKIQQSKDKWIYYKKFKKRSDNLVAAVIVDRTHDDWIEIITVLINFEVKK